MWHLMPSQVCPLLHTTAYPVAPSSIRDPSVNIVSPDRALSASALASAACVRSVVHDSYIYFRNYWFKVGAGLAGIYAAGAARLRREWSKDKYNEVPSVSRTDRR